MARLIPIENISSTFSSLADLFSHFRYGPNLPEFKVYDLRNLYSAEEMKKNKIKYYSVGRPNTN